MNQQDRVAVTSRSFSRNPRLREELLKRYSRVTFNEQGVQLFGDSLVEFLQGHDKAITALESINESVLSRLPELRIIGKYGVGLDMIDLEAMRRHGKRLGHTPGVNRRSVSELVVAFSIVLLHLVPQATREVLQGVWRQLNGHQLTGKTVGIIGCGNIGKDLVQLLQPFACRILVHDIVKYPDFYQQYSVEPVSLEQLLALSDVVSLHVPLDESTQNMLSADRLAMIRPQAILINAARGGLVDEPALRELLKQGRIAAAAFDVFAQEPPTDAELLSLPNFLVTPHIGGSTVEAVFAMGMAAIEGLDRNEIP